jgi:hypothetical protein
MFKIKLYYKAQQITCTTRFKTEKQYILFTEWIYVFLFPKTALIDWSSY